jgi:hypothetical protein
MKKGWKKEEKEKNECGFENVGMGAEAIKN